MRQIFGARGGRLASKHQGVRPIGAQPQLFGRQRQRRVARGQCIGERAREQRIPTLTAERAGKRLRAIAVGILQHGEGGNPLARDRQRRHRRIVFEQQIAHVLIGLGQLGVPFGLSLCQHRRLFAEVQAELVLPKGVDAPLAGPQRVADLLVGDREIMLPAGAAGIPGGDLGDHGEALAEPVQGLRRIAALHERIAQPVGAGGPVLLPLGARRVSRRQRFDDRQIPAVIGDRLGVARLIAEELAEPPVAQRQIALTVGLIGRGDRQALRDLQVFFVLGLRLGFLSQRHQHLADLGVTDRFRLLPFGIARLRGGHLFAQAQALAVGGERGFGVAFRSQHLGDFLVRDRQILIVAGVAGRTARQLLENVETLLVGGQRVGPAAHLEQGVAPAVVGDAQAVAHGGLVHAAFGAGNQLAEHGHGFVGGGQGRVRIALREQGLGQFGLRVGLTLQQVRALAASFRQILGQLARLAQHVDDELLGYARLTSEPARQIQHQIVRGLGALFQHPLGAIALAVGLDGFKYRYRRQHGERCRGHVGGVQRPPLLAQFVRKQIFLRYALHRRRDIGRAGLEIRVACGGFGVRCPISRQIDPFGLGAEAPAQGGRQRCRGVPQEVAAAHVPTERAGGQHNENGLRAFRQQPVRHLLVDPGRRRGLRRRDQHQKTGGIQRRLDIGPQVWRRRQAGIVAEHMQRAPAPPRLAERLHDRLQRLRHRFVAGVAIGDEGVIQRHAAFHQELPPVVSAANRSERRCSLYSVLVIFKRQ